MFCKSGHILAPMHINFKGLQCKTLGEHFCTIVQSYFNSAKVTEFYSNNVLKVFNADGKTYMPDFFLQIQTYQQLLMQSMPIYFNDHQTPKFNTNIITATVRIWSAVILIDNFLHGSDSKLAPLYAHS